MQKFEIYDYGSHYVLKWFCPKISATMPLSITACRNHSDILDTIASCLSKGYLEKEEE